MNTFAHNGSVAVLLIARGGIVADSLPSSSLARNRGEAERKAVRADGVAQPVQRLERVEHEHHSLGGAAAQGGQHCVDLRYQHRDQYQIPGRRRIKFMGNRDGRPLTGGGHDRMVASKLFESATTRDDRYVVTRAG